MFENAPTMKLSVLMPVYNEARTLRTIVPRVLASPVDLEVELVAVDDGSSDDSVEILHKLAAGDPRIRVIVQPHNMGKGKAIRTAIEHMTGDIGIVQDADLEYDPEEYPKVLAPILEGKADAVYGSRFAASEERRVLFFWHSMGNKALTALSNMACDLNLTDMETCYKAVRGDILKSLRLTSDRFGIEPEITARLAAWGARIYEVPISYHGRTYAEGKNIGWKDGLQALWLIFKFRFLDTRYSNNSGKATLEGLARAPRVAAWTLEQFEGHLGDEVLEAGCGIGNFTAALLDRKRLHAVDIDSFYVTDLARRYGHLSNVTVTQGDLENPATFDGLTGFDSVVSSNVLEHLDNPDRALAGFHRVLRPGGYALILVPAHPRLFSAADEALEHRKRYTEAVLRHELESAGFEVDSIRQFNRLGVLGWWVNKQTQRTSISPWQARMFSFLLPLARLIEKVEALPGLSLIAVARTPDHTA
jgi:glycosyltransferase involved in cell wall biosynthesis